MENKLRLSKLGVIRFGILYLMFLGMWIFFRSYMLFLALILIPFLIFLSGAVLWASRDKVWAETAFPGERVGKGTQISFDVRVHNKARFIGFASDVSYRLSNVFTGYTDIKKMRIWLPPIKGCEIEQWLTSQYAGRVEAVIEEFVVYDLFHVFFLSECIKKSTGVLVWPGFIQEEAEEVYSCVEGFPRDNETKKYGTEYNPDYEVREYIPGDELKSIHWKLSAKQEQLMVRQRLASGREKINVLLPLGSDRTENDGLIGSLYGLGLVLLKKEYPIQLYWPGKGQLLHGKFVAEAGELENVIGEILSGAGNPEQNAQVLMEMEHPGEKYILVQTGAYKGAYIR